jgi:hypothetical protein
VRSPQKLLEQLAPCGRLAILAYGQDSPGPRRTNTHAFQECERNYRFLPPELQMIDQARRSNILCCRQPHCLDHSAHDLGDAVGMEMRNTTLNTVVRSAYGLNEFRPTGGPKWVFAKFNVIAKLPTGVTRD